MPKTYTIPAGESQIELRVANSRFIATLAPVFTVEEARAFVDKIKAQFADASHNVPAYIVGHGSTVIAHSSDDGEPSGTAGRPALAVLKGSGLGDAAVVVTRYFGGTKLGTGGLVRAYGDAVRAVLENAPRARKVPTFTTMLRTPYPLFEQVSLLVENHAGLVLDRDFAAEAMLKVRFTQDAFPRFQEDLRELSRGSLAADIVEESDATIMPLSEEDSAAG